jgi:hypothetical protein
LAIVAAAGRYIQQLLRLWLCWFMFPILDALLLVTDRFIPAVSVPPAVYPSLLAIGFLCANVKLFADQEQRISQLEARQADIRLTLRDSGFDHSHSGRKPGFPQVREMGPYGFDEHGMPGYAVLWANLEIENVGYEEGDLVLEIVRSKTALPRLFAIGEQDVGWFHGGAPRRIERRTRISKQWCLDLQIPEQEPEAFARALPSLSMYRVVIQYHTRRIGGESQRSKLVIEGNFSTFRHNVLEHWKGFGFDRLAELGDSEC